MLKEFLLNKSLGYLKDFIAVFIFLIGFIIVYSFKNINHLKPLILLGITFGFILDLYFSLNPTYHNMPINQFIKNL